MKNPDPCHVLVEDLHDTVAMELKKNHLQDLKPTLAILCFGTNPLSEVHISQKIKSCDKFGIKVIVDRFSVDASEDTAVEWVNRMSTDPMVHGILTQMPLPDQISNSRLFLEINPQKDVDGLNPINVGQIFYHSEAFKPAVVEAIIRLIRKLQVSLKGKNVVIVGSSSLISLPLSLYLQANLATLTVCNEYSQEKENLTSNADILIAAAGSPHLIKKDWVKQGAIVIDVGISETETGKIISDVDYDDVRTVADYITPSPGGIGPLTVSCLLLNILRAVNNFGNE